MRVAVFVQDLAQGGRSCNSTSFAFERADSERVHASLVQVDIEVMILLEERSFKL